MPRSKRRHPERQHLSNEDLRNGAITGRASRPRHITRTQINDEPTNETTATAPSRVGLAGGDAAGGGRVYAAPLYSTGTRRERRRTARQARAVLIQARRDRAAADARARQAARRDQHATRYLPAGGEAGPDALRSYRRLRVAPHRATSEVLAAAYPFLAEAGLGAEGIFIGQDAWSGSSFCYDPWVLYRNGVLTNPNALLAGVVGTGKSMLAKCLATRSIAFGHKVYIAADPKGEWTPVAHAVGGQAIALGGGAATRLNPLDEGPRQRGTSDEQWRATVTARRLDLLRAITESALGRELRSVEATALTTALRTAVSANDVPTLPMVVEAMFRPDADVTGSTVAQLIDHGRETAHALSRLVGGDLGGLFDGPSTARFDPDLPMVTLDMSRIQGSDQLIALVMTCASTWMEAALADPSGGQCWVIYEEAWRLLHSLSLLARMQRRWKLARALGIANLLILHRISDLSAVGEADSEARNLALGLLADCSTKIIYAQEAGEAGKTAAALGLSTTEARELPNLIRGEGLWRIHQHAYIIRHTCTPGELATFDTNTRMHASAPDWPPNT